MMEMGHPVRPGNGAAQATRPPAVEEAMREIGGRLQALRLPDALVRAIEQLIAFGTRLPGRAAAIAGRGDEAGQGARRLHQETLRLPVLLGGAVSGDPAWNMLLALAADEEAGRATTVSCLCRASGAPATTALRYIQRLEERGLAARRGDSDDRRRTLVTLTEAGRTSTYRAIAALGGMAADNG